MTLFKTEEPIDLQSLIFYSASYQFEEKLRGSVTYLGLLGFNASNIPAFSVQYNLFLILFTKAKR